MNRPTPHPSARAAVDGQLQRIPARSRRVAVDWSLVLTSQGVESALAESQTGWELRVRLEDHGRALAILEQYRAENLRPPLARELPGTGLWFHWGVLFWIVWMIALFGVSQGDRNPIRLIGLMDSGKVLHGEWWRLFTAVTLHADLAHLAGNLTSGFLVLGLAMGRYGAGLALLAGFLAGAAGNLLSLGWHDESHRSLGASGMVMGAIGLLAAESVAWWRQSKLASRYALGGLAASAFLFLLWGSDAASDVAAHLGGAVGGLVLGVAISRLAPKSETRLALSPLAGLLTVLLLILAWSLAR